MYYSELLKSKHDAINSIKAEATMTENFTLNIGKEMHKMNDEHAKFIHRFICNSVLAYNYFKFDILKEQAERERQKHVSHMCYSVLSMNMEMRAQAKFIDYNKRVQLE